MKQNLFDRLEVERDKIDLDAFWRIIQEDSDRLHHYEHCTRKHNPYQAFLLRYNLNGDIQMTLQEIAEYMKISREYARMCVVKVERRMRHPRNKNKFLLRGLTPVVGDAASPPDSGEQTRTSGQAGEGSAPHPPRV